MNIETTLLGSIFAPNSSFDMQKDIVFSVPLHIDLGDNGGIVALKSFFEAGVFAYNELKIWQEIIGKKPLEKPFIQKIIAQQFRAPCSIYEMAEKALNGQISTTESMIVIRKDLNTYLGYKTLHSVGTLGQMSSIMYRYEPMLLGILAGASGSATLADAKGLNTSADAESFTFGYAFTLQFQTNIQPDQIDGRVTETTRKVNAVIRRLEMAEKQLKPLEKDHFSLQKGVVESTTQLHAYRQEVEQCLSQLVMDTKQTSDRAVNEMWTQLNLIQSDHERQLASLRQSVSSRVRYGTALDYWNAERNLNQDKVNQMTAWFVISGLFSILTVLAIAFGISRSSMTSNIFVTIATLGLPIVIACFLIFMLIQTRSKYENLVLQALEKVSLLETLASLETEGRSSESDREPILESIFKTNFAKPVFADKPQETNTPPAL